MLVYPGQAQFGPAAGQMPGAMPVLGQSAYPPQFQPAPSSMMQMAGAPAAMAQGGFNYGIQPGWDQPVGPTAYLTAGIGNIPTMASTVGMGAGFASLFTQNRLVHAASYLDPTTLGLNMGAARFGSVMGIESGMSAGAMMSRVAANRALLPAAMGAGIGAAAGPLALATAAYEGLRYTGQQFMAGGREQLAIGSQLGGYQFANPLALTGRGFSSGGVSQIRHMMEGIDKSDAFTTMHDLTGLLDQFNQSGMGRGMQDAQEFSRKFKKFAETAREMAKALGTTIEEAGRVFQTMRGSGFYTAADVIGNTRGMRLSRGLGMGEETYHQMQQQGAATARSMGLRGRGGALTSARLANDLLIGAKSRASGGLGLYSDEELMDITGAGSGADAAAMMGNDLAAGLGRFLTSTAAGNAFAAVLGEQKDGRFTGGLDQAMLAKMAGGGISERDLSRIGGARMGSSARSKLSFDVNRNKIASSILESESGVDAVMRAIEVEGEKWGKSQGLDGDDAQIKWMQHHVGWDRATSEKFVKNRKHQLESRLAKMKTMRQEAASAALALDLQQNYTLAGIEQQISGGWDDFWSPTRGLGGDFEAWKQRKWMGAVDTVTGVARYDQSMSAQHDSVMRLATGGSRLGAGDVTAVSAQDFEKGTAGYAMALSAAYGSSPGGGQAGLDRAMAIQRKIAAGGQVTADDIGTTRGERTRISEFAATPEGQAAQLSIRRAQNAKAVGDTKTHAKEMEKARSAMEQSIYANKDLEALGKGKGSRVSHIAISELRGRGDSDKNFAEFARQAGWGDVATEIMGKGDVRLHGYEDVTSLKEGAIAALSEAGISGELAEQLASGGAGSSLFTAISGTGNGGMDFFDKLDVGAGSNRLDRLAVAASKKLGGNYTASDVEAVLKAQGQVRAVSGMGTFEKFQNDYMGGWLFAPGKVAAKGYDWAFGSDTSENAVAESLALAGGRVGGLSDYQVSRTGAQAAAAGFGTATSEMKGAFGKELDAAIASLSGGDMQTAISDIDKLITAAGKAGVGGMAGGKDLGMLYAQQQAGLAAARSEDIEGVLRAFGGAFTEADIRKFAGVSGAAVLTNANLEAAVHQMSGVTGFSAGASGAGGGIYRRGESAEAQMVMNVQSVTDSVLKLTGAVDLVVAKQKEDASWFESIMSPDAPSVAPK